MMMKNNKNGGQPSGRRLRKDVDGPKIREWYAWMPTAEVARRLGLKPRQVSDFAYRNNFEGCLGKDKAERKKVATENGKKGGRPRRKT